MRSPTTCAGDLPIDPSTSACNGSLMSRDRERISVTYISKDGIGHHADYDRLFEAALAPFNVSLQRVAAPGRGADARAPLFYSFFDTKPSETLAALGRATLRSWLGRPTVGLMFRPGDCFIAGSVKSRLRRLLFRCVAHLPHVHLLSIIPLALEPRLAEVATNWIYDPQLWDLEYLHAVAREPSREIRDPLQAAARGRRLVVALGLQNRGKGFDYFVDVWCASSRLRAEYLFVAAGKVSDESSANAKRFVEQGGILFNGRIADEDLFYLYGEADRIWSCYSPDYDQSSGIHGRAIQLGIPVLVREGSYIDAFGKLLAHPSLALPMDAPLMAAERMQAWQAEAVSATQRRGIIDNMKSHSIAVLLDALTRS